MQIKRVVGVLLVLAFCTSLSQIWGEEVSRQPPSFYKEQLAELLTPLDVALKSLGKEDDLKDEDGVILLDESIHYVDEKGRRYLVLHSIFKALTDAGAKAMAEDTWNYRKANQKIHLVLARTILPDGKQLAVQPDAALLQSPQRQADYSLYDDQGELRVIYPNVKQGTITEHIVLIDESQFRIPGEFTSAVSCAFNWPALKMRCVVDLPSPLADRLRITNLGEAVPEPTKAVPAPNRVRLTWSADNIPSLPHEPNRPPTTQVGPAVWLTTLADWDAFVAWYAPQVESSAMVKPALAKQIDEWTSQTQSPAEILAILMSKVATDVRYVGLEFGSADFQPHDCNAVWENQYGDCKDKATLLRSMLRYKGIEAHLVLLNTSNAGLIERRSPDFRHFSHAITAVELEKGHYLFCDPTIAYGMPGVLTPSDAGREVLVIKDGKAEWTRTPEQEAGKLHYDFDLKFAADGELAGWLSVEASGYYGAWQAETFAKADKNQLREKAHDIIVDFFKGAELVDVTKSSLEKWDGRSTLKMYFLVPAASQDGQSNQSLAFPNGSALFVNLGAQKKRKTPYYLWPDVVKVTANIHLPEGITPTDLPHPYKLDSQPLDAVAQWSVNGRECRASLDMHVKQSLLSPEQFEVLFNSLRSVHAWLDNPLTLAIRENAAAQPQETGLTLENFPMMPTGDGQLELVEKRFPSNGDVAMRREALQKVIQYFPFDKNTLFMAGVKLAIIDWDDGKSKEAEETIRKQLNAYRSAVTAENIGWGEYLLARVLVSLKQTEEADQIFERIGSNKQLSAYRRSWADYYRALALESKSRKRAIELLREGIGLNDEASPQSFSLLGKLLILDGRLGELKKEIKEMVAKKSPQYAAMLTQLAESTGDMLPPDKADAQAALIKFLAEVGQTADLGKRFGDALQESRDNARAVAASAQIRKQLKAQLAKKAPSNLPPPPSQCKTREDFARASEQAEKESKPADSLRCVLELLTRFEPNSDFPAYLWRAAKLADWLERFQEKPEPLLPVLLGFCDQLPHDNDNYFEGKFLRAKLHERRGEMEEAQKIHQGLADNPNLPAGYKMSALERLAGNMEKRGNYSGALKVYALTEPEIQYASAKDGLLRAAFINLEQGHRDEALRILSLLGTRSEATIKQADTGWQIKEMADLVKDKQKAAAYWDATAKWWPAWLAIEERMGLKPPSSEEYIPAFPQSSEFNEGIAQAQRAKDQDAYFKRLRKVAYGARWEPLLTVDLARNLALNAPGVAPAYAEDVRKLTLAIYENFTSEDTELLRKMQIYAAAAHLDLDQTPEAAKVVHAFFDQKPDEDSYTETMSRIWGVVAKQDKSELKSAVAALEKRLAASRKLDDRGRDVMILADLYHNADRTADEEALLKREMAHPEIKADQADLQRITARHEQLAKSGEQSKQLATAVQQWLQKRKLAWYEFAEPKSLDDPRLSNLEEVLKKPGSLFTQIEQIKLNLLVAGAAEQPTDRREQSFMDALEGLSDLMRTKEEYRGIYEPIIDETSFTEWIRVECLWRAIGAARFEDDAGHFEKLRVHPLSSRFSDTSKANCALMKEALAVDQSSSAAVSAFCSKLLSKDLTRYSKIELQQFFARLLELDQVPDAEKIYKQLAAVRIDPESGISRASLQMEFLKSLNRAKKWQASVNAMRDVVLEKYPAESIPQPAIYATLHDRSDVTMFEPEIATQIYLHQIATRQYGQRIGFQFWKEFGSALRSNEDGQQLAFRLLEAALKNSPGDAEAAEIISAGDSFFDSDNPRHREVFAQMIKPFRNSEKYPNAYGAIRIFEIYVGWRSGQLTDVTGELQKLRNPESSYFVTRTRLNCFVQNRDIPQLRKTLESLGPDELLSDGMLPLTLEAFKIAGMAEDLALAKDAGKKTLYRAILSAWADPEQRRDVSYVYKLAAELHETSSIPPEWFAAIDAKIKNTRNRLFLRADEAALREDWPRLLAVADEAIPKFPSYYHFYWYKGLALHKMGKTQQAVAPLKTFADYSHNEDEYPQAKAWLQELENPSDVKGR